MSYQVLARKWRPRSFPQMVGQEHVLRALINALDNDRLHHAFLFTGTRGVGKTTVARILAKSINCERGMSSSPCGECTSCREIDEGRFVDLIEVDAASRTRVEDTRDLLDNVQYAPSRGRYKVYLIDEVHMLSNHSFNALLKTLEEPPPHVKFLLATTDPQKLPVTILSRCLQFNLKRMPAELIRDHLVHIVGQEGLVAEPGALAEIARAADGSMRDALSLLDQAIAYGAGRLLLEEVRAMLGTIDRDHLFRLLDALADGDGARLIGTVRQMDERSPDYGSALAELVTLLQRIALAQVVPEGLSGDFGDEAAVKGLAQRLPPEDVQLYYQIALLGRRDLPLAPEPRPAFEMTLLRMLAFRPQAQGEEPKEARAPSGRAMTAEGGRGEAVPLAISIPVSSRPLAADPIAPVSPVSIEEEPGVVAAVAGTSEVPSGEEGAEQEWSRLVAALPLAGVTRQLALNCALVSREGDSFVVRPEAAAERLRSPQREEALRRAIEEYVGRPVRLLFQSIGPAPAGATPAQLQQRRTAARQQEAEQAFAADPEVRELLSRFEGSVVPGSIRPGSGESKS